VFMSGSLVTIDLCIAGQSHLGLQRWMSIRNICAILSVNGNSTSYG
jgi:hypothetical protein